MKGRYLLFAILMVFSLACLAQQTGQLDKKQKKELKALQKEGWKTMDPAADLAEQYLAWHQKETEQLPNGSNKYTMVFSEIEDANLQIAERRAWGDACSAIRRGESMKTSSTMKIKEYSDGRGDEHSDVSLSQRDEMAYAGAMKDIVKVLAIYKKTKKGYMVRIVAAKANR